MGKRSNFERNDKDKYRTPLKAVLPLLPHLLPWQTYAEPCAGDGRLVSHLSKFGYKCAWMADATPDVPWIMENDATQCGKGGADLFITNPPWRRDWLHPIIENLAAQAPTWLLFDADWPHTLQAVPYMPICRKIVSVGRVRWIKTAKITVAGTYLTPTSGEKLFSFRA